MRIYGGLNSDAYSGVQQWIEVAGAQGLLSSIFFFSTVKPVLVVAIWEWLTDRLIQLRFDKSKSY